MWGLSLAGSVPGRGTPVKRKPARRIIVRDSSASVGGTKRAGGRRQAGMPALQVLLTVFHLWLRFKHWLLSLVVCRAWIRRVFPERRDLPPSLYADRATDRDEKSSPTWRVWICRRIFGWRFPRGAGRLRGCSSYLARPGWRVLFCLYPY